MTLAIKQRRILVRERKRIRYVHEQYGLNECIGFCRQGILQYQRALQTGYGKAYSEELRCSIVMYVVSLKDILKI